MPRQTAVTGPACNRAAPTARDDPDSIHATRPLGLSRRFRIGARQPKATRAHRADLEASCLLDSSLRSSLIEAKHAGETEGLRLYVSHPALVPGLPRDVPNPEAGASLRTTFIQRSSSLKTGREDIHVCLYWQGNLYWIFYPQHPNHRPAWDKHATKNFYQPCIHEIIGRCALSVRKSPIT